MWGGVCCFESLDEAPIVSTLVHSAGAMTDRQDGLTDKMERRAAIDNQPLHSTAPHSTAQRSKCSDKELQTDFQADSKADSSVVRVYRLKIIAKYSKNYEKLENTRKNKTVSA